MLSKLMRGCFFSCLTLALAGCATTSTSTSEGVNDTVVAYGADRPERLESDLNAMWQIDRTAGEWYSAVEARGAARRVFEDMNKTFHGTSADVITFLNHPPESRTADTLVYRIQAPTYTDTYTIRLVNDQFQRVDRVRSPRLKTTRD